MHEIVTLQLGEQANHVGSHFWNTQESYFTYGGQEASPVDHDILFRPGVGADGADTYTPRTIVYDFKAKWGSLRRLNALYDVGEEREWERGTWSGSTVPHRNPPIQASEYQQALDAGTAPPRLTPEQIRYWSDYSRVFYHPKSVVQIYESELNPGQQVFEDWQSGEDLFQALDREDDLFERDVRPFVEECDQMQGMQLFTSANDAWSGFTARYLDRLRDEVGKLPIWVWAASGQRENTPTSNLRQAVNESRSLFDMSQTASKYIPMAGAPYHALPGWIDRSAWMAESGWMRSALQATALESISLCWRLKPASEGARRERHGNMEQSTMEMDIGGKQKIAHLSFEANNPEGLMVPGNGIRDDDEAGARAAGRRCDLFPSAAGSESAAGQRHTFAEMMLTRGSGFDVSEAVGEEATTAAAATSSLPGPSIHRYRTQVQFPLLDSFPRVFRGTAGDATSVRAWLTASDAVAGWAQSLERRCRRQWPLEDREEIGDGLQGIVEAYTAGEMRWEESETDEWD